ncbi:hypothetical protein ABFS83_04G230700 [Erythranthe nasuta]
MKDPNIAKSFGPRNWNDFVGVSGEYNVNLVRLFYAIGSQSDGLDGCLVRNTMIKFDVETINYYYALPSNVDIEPFRQLRWQTQYADLIQAFCPRGLVLTGGKYILRQ